MAASLGYDSNSIRSSLPHTLITMIAKAAHNLNNLQEVLCPGLFDQVLKPKAVSDVDQYKKAYFLPANVLTAETSRNEFIKKAIQK